MLKQRLSGLALLVIGIIIPFVCDGDITGTMLVAPIGGYALFTKNKIVD